MIEPGTLLLGKYRIERVIGEGGMGVVALAHHLQLDQPVAIKFLLPHVLENREVVQRFLREAQAAVRLRSEHVARVIDVGTLDTGAPYMVMEYLDGMDLGDLLRQQGPLAPGVAVDLMLQACEALAEAHALGIVHRDIKPSNFFITRRASGTLLLKVLDFGISKTSVTVDEGITSTQAILGTPAYMSPEQMRSTKHVDARTDIWAMGVVLYESLCGMRPFTGDTFSALCLKVAMDPLPPLSVPLPPGMAAVVARCLEKEPSARFHNVAELALALAPFARTPTQAASSVERTAGVLGLAAGPPLTLPGSGTGRAISAGVGVPVVTPPTTMGASSGELAAVSGQTSRLGVVLGAAGAVLVLAALVLVFAGGEGADSPAPTPVITSPAAAGEGAGSAEGAEAAEPEIERDDTHAVQAAAAAQPDAGVAAADPVVTPVVGSGHTQPDEDGAARRDRRKDQKRVPGRGDRKQTGGGRGGDLDNLFDSRQ